MKIKFENNTLVIGNTKKILPCEILKTLEIGNNILVLFNVYDYETDDYLDINKNIWAFDHQGNKLWEIEYAWYPKDEDDNRKRDNPYMNMRLEGGEVRVYDFITAHYHLDLNTGKISDPVQDK